MKEQLISIISNLSDGQLAYQWCDELLSVLDKNTKHIIIDAIRESSIIEHVNKDVIGCCGFDELTSWAQDKDELYLINNELLICLAENDARLIH